MSQELWQVWARDKGLGRKPYKVGDPVPQAEALEQVQGLKDDPKVKEAWMDNGAKAKK